MESKNKQELLAKFWEGETTPQEEMQLMAWNENDTSFLSEEDKTYLNFLQAQRSAELPENFGVQFLDQLEANETAIQNKQKHITPVRKLSWWNTYTKIAMTLLFLIGIGFIYQQRATVKHTALKTPRFADASTQQAYIEAQRALLLVSQKLAKVKTISTALGKFDAVKGKITQNIK